MFHEAEPLRVRAGGGASIGVPVDSRCRCGLGCNGDGDVGLVVYRKRNIFEEKRSCLRQIENELRAVGENVNLSTADSWEEGANDDEINEP